MPTLAINTTYHILTAPELRALKLESNVIWPAVIAKRGDAIVGRLGTLDYEDMVVAGDLWIEKGITPRVALRLLEMYEIILQSLGIKEYMFSVALDEPKWKQVVDKAGVFTRVEEVEGFAWYRRDLNEWRRRCAGP